MRWRRGGGGFSTKYVVLLRCFLAAHDNDAACVCPARLSLTITTHACVRACVFRPLIVMHRHHQQQNKAHAALFADWGKRGLLYLCERGNNDDWYWLWATVQTANPDSLLISNDEMKDHHFNMLRPKHFQRWKIRHQVCGVCGCAVCLFLFVCRVFIWLVASSRGAAFIIQPRRRGFTAPEGVCVLQQHFAAMCGRVS
jgi:hypothetical protein